MNAGFCNNAAHFILPNPNVFNALYVLGIEQVFFDRKLIPEEIVMVCIHS